MGHCIWQLMINFCIENFASRAFWWFREKFWAFSSRSWYELFKKPSRNIWILQDIYKAHFYALMAFPKFSLKKTQKFSIFLTKNRRLKKNKRYLIIGFVKSAIFIFGISFSYIIFTKTSLFSKLFTSFRTASNHCQTSTEILWSSQSLVVNEAW